MFDSTDAARAVSAAIPKPDSRTAANSDDLSLAERRRFADICRHWARIARVRKTDGEQNGVLKAI